MKLATDAQVLVFFFVRVQRWLQRVKAGMKMSLYVFSFLHVTFWTVCRWSHLSVFSLPHQEDFDDDYESPYSGDDAESVEDYELPNDDVANDYEPPPCQPSEELKVCPSLPLGDNDYIGNHKLFYHNCYLMDRFNGFLGVSIYAIFLPAYCILKIRFLCAL